MTFWTPAQLDCIRANLLDERRRLAAALRGRLHDDGRDAPPGLHRYLADELDAADAAEQLDDDLAWLGHEAAGLRRVDAALRRLAARRYGWCADCGAPIPAERLLAQPATERCLPCQEEAERSAAPGSRGAH